VKKEVEGIHRVDFAQHFRVLKEHLAALAKTVEKQQ